MPPGCKILDVWMDGSLWYITSILLPLVKGSLVNEFLHFPKDIFTAHRNSDSIKQVNHTMLLIRIVTILLCFTVG
jgi:hypothetical protein